MGTSSRYNAPTTPDWSDLKGQVTRTARSSYTSPQSMKNILNDFVRAGGRARNISRGGGVIGIGRSAQNTASRLANFISTVEALGFERSLELIGLPEFIGKPTSEIIPAIVDKIGGPSSTINDTDARNALSRVMDELLSGLNTPEQVEEALNAVIKDDALESLLHQFFGYYLYEQFCRVFYERLVNRVGHTSADSYLKSILDTIKSALKLMVCDKNIGNIDWSGAEGQNLVNQILQDTLEIFGG